MKKFKLTVALGMATLLFALESQAQSTGANCFRKGSNIINLGIGLGTTIYDAGYSGTFPPIGVSYERGIANGKWGIGGIIAHIGAKYGDDSGYWKYSYTIIGVRGAYHFYTTDKIDAYGGLMLGYDIVSDKWHGQGGVYDDYNASGSEGAYSLFVGGRYFFNPHLGAYAELGYGIAWLNVGLTFKL